MNKLELELELELLDGTMSDEKRDMLKELIRGEITQEDFDTWYWGYNIINKLNVIHENLECFKEGTPAYDELIKEANTITDGWGFTDWDDIDTFLEGIEKKSEM